jgi:transcriptional regulator GlxA family with amidase domain
MAEPQQDRSPKVSILVLPESTPAALYGLYEVFASVGRTWEELTGAPSDAPSLSPRLVARSLDPIQSALGFAITPNGVLDDADVVIVTDIAIPGTADLPAIWDRELDWLRERHAAGAILCSVCTGTTVLAEAGLLDGIEATTHCRRVAAGGTTGHGAMFWLTRKRLEGSYRRLTSRSRP